MAAPRSKMNEIARYKAEVGSGGWSIKLMTLGLMAGTVWFAYTLEARGRLPWQHSPRVCAACYERRTMISADPPSRTNLVQVQVALEKYGIKVDSAESQSPG